MTRLWGTVILLLLMQVGIGPRATPQTPAALAVAVCLDPGDDCPSNAPRARMLLPDLLTLPPHDFRLLYDEASGQKALRFSNSVVNLGPAAIEIRGTRAARGDQVQVHQKIPRSDGSSIWLPIGELILHPEHEHWHWTEFSIYEVWSLTGGGRLKARIAESGKVSYCLRDNEPLLTLEHKGVALRTDEVPEKGVFGGCSWQRQGISAGWTDIYDYKTPGQQIDLTGAPDGVYALRSVVDPTDRLIEADENNNTAIVYFSLYGARLEYFGPNLPRVLIR